MIKKYKRWRTKRQMRSADILLWKIDNFMKEQKWPAYKRKQFWHSFIKSPRLRAEIFRDILKVLQ